MGTLTEYGFEGTAGTTASAAAVGATSGAGTWYYRGGAKIGATCLSCEANTSSANRRFPVAASLSQGFSVWIKLPATSSGQTDRTILSLRSSGGVIAWLRYDYVSSTTAALEFVPNASGTATPLGTVTADGTTWVGVSALVTVATATTGQFHIRILDAAGSQIGSDVDITTANLGTVNVEAYDLGTLGSFAEAPTVRFDGFRTEDSPSGYLAMAVATNTAPTANAGPDQTVQPGATITLDGTASTDPDGTITTWTWTQTDGPTITLSGTGATRTGTAPYAMTQQTATFGLTVTDDAAATSTQDTMIVTIPAHPHWHHNGTAWKAEVLASL